MATGSRAPLAPPASTPAGRGRGRPKGSLTARGGERHSNDNGVSQPARRRGGGRGRQSGSGGTGREQSAGIESMMASWQS